MVGGFVVVVEEKRVGAKCCLCDSQFLGHAIRCKVSESVSETVDLPVILIIGAGGSALPSAQSVSDLGTDELH